MRRSSTERPRYRLVLLVLLTACGAREALAQFATGTNTRLVNVIEISDHEDPVDLTVIFNCSMRFITNLPASEGKEVRIQLAPLADCGLSPLAQVLSEMPPISGGGNILAVARLESLAPGQITLTLTFRQSERFVVAQGTDPRGLRLRLIDRTRGRGKIVVGQPAEAVSNFAINLDSQPSPFTPEAIQLAHERLKAPVFVSEAMVEGEKWYRLRVGPIERRSEADRILNLALPDYPRAWLAIGDDAVTSELNAAPGQPAALPVEKIGSDPPLPPEVLKSMMADVRTAMSARDYPKALALLTKLQRQPEFPERAHAQELLGLARERSGQLAHAKAEYEEYLRRYPQGEAAERVAFRLRILRAAEAKARTGRQGEGDTSGWELAGGLGQTLRYDGSRVTNGAPPPNTQLPPAAQTDTQNALFTDVDLLARHRGETYDWVGRLSAGYDKAFGQESTTLGSATRVSLASVEMVDRPLGLLTRLGRQAVNQDGILGTFDGLYMSWQFKPSWAVNAAAGYPVEQLNLAPQTDERFATLALAYTPLNAHWDGSVFVAAQRIENLRDREAVGVEGRYLSATATVVSVIDYDVAYHSLNTASVLGTLQLPARWNVSFDAERRNTPVLTTRNALIGQPFTDMAQLQQVFTPDEIYQLARDRTAVSSIFSFTATKPIGQRFQITGIVAATQTGATPASGGVEAVPATGMLLTYQAQVYGSGLFQASDFNVLTFTHSNTEIGRIDSISANSRFVITGAWRLGPRLTVDRLKTMSDGSTQTTFIPSLLLDYQRGLNLFQLEVGGQLGSREAFLQLQNGAFVQTQKTTRYYVSVSYRLGFRH